MFERAGGSFLHGAARDANNSRAFGNVPDDDGSRSDFCTGADDDGSKNAGVRSDDDALLNPWMPDIFLVGRSAEKNTLVNDDVIFDDGGFSDHDTHAMVDKDPPADSGGRMNFDAGDEPRQIRKEARRKAQMPVPQAMENAVKPKGMKAGVAEEDIQARQSRGIVGHRGRDVLPDARKDAHMFLNKVLRFRIARHISNCTNLIRVLTGKIDSSMVFGEALFMDDEKLDDAGKPCMRRDSRYVETSLDLSDWIQVKLVEQFGEQIEISGLLVDLTRRAIKVAFPTATVTVPPLAVGKRLLITFRFKNLISTTASATISRMDYLPNGLAVVLFFDFIREADRETIDQICQAYRRDPSSEPLHP